MDFLDDLAGLSAVAVASATVIAEFDLVQQIVPSAAASTSAGAIAGFDFLQELVHLGANPLESGEPLPLHAAQAQQQQQHPTLLSAAREKDPCWGHWKSLTVEQKAYRGAKMREGKHRKRYAVLAKDIDGTVENAINDLASQSQVRARIVKRATRRSCTLSRGNRRGHSNLLSVQKNVLGRLCFIKHDGARLSFSHQHLIRIAFSAGKASQKAVVAQCARSTVGVVETAMAHIGQRVQSILFDRVADFSGTTGPCWVMCHLMWTETSERMVLGSAGHFGTDKLPNVGFISQQHLACSSHACLLQLGIQ